MTVDHQQQHFSPCPGSIEKKHQTNKTTTPQLQTKQQKKVPFGSLYIEDNYAITLNN